MRVGSSAAARGSVVQLSGASMHAAWLGAVWLVLCSARRVVSAGRSDWGVLANAMHPPCCFLPHALPAHTHAQCLAARALFPTCAPLTARCCLHRAQVQDATPECAGHLKGAACLCAGCCWRSCCVCHVCAASRVWRQSSVVRQWRAGVLSRNASRSVRGLGGIASQ